jgi:hypothetical protein
MAAKGNFELLCLENPLLDIQGVGYVPLQFQAALIMPFSYPYTYSY